MNNIFNSLDESEYESAFSGDDANEVPRMATPMPMMPAAPMQQTAPMMPFVPSVVFPLPPQYGMGQQAPEPFYAKRVAGLPVWLWGTIALGGGALYFASRKSSDAAQETPKPAAKKLASNASKREKDSFQPSRSRFADALQRKYGSSVEKVYIEADEAKAHCKTVSPLVNAKMKAGFKIDKAFEDFCKQEGLFPVEHEDSVGFYPEDGTPRGEAQSEYVDLLREDGLDV